MKAVLLFICLFFMSSQSYGVIVGKIQIQGTVVKYDKNTVTLKNNKGQRIKIKKLSIPKNVKLKTGKKITAFLSPEILTKRFNKKDSKQTPNNQ